jgi:hypothetical protein
VQEELHQDRRFEEARHRRDKFARDPAERLLGDIRRRIRPELCESLFRFSGRQTNGAFWAIRADNVGHDHVPSSIAPPAWTAIEPNRGLQRLIQSKNQDFRSP